MKPLAHQLASDSQCAQDVAALAVVLGAALCVGALSLLIGLGTKKHRFQGDDFFPYPYGFPDLTLLFPVSTSLPATGKF